jgi:hypothetical protein
VYYCRFADPLSQSRAWRLCLAGADGDRRSLLGSWEYKGLISYSALDLETFIYLLNFPLHCQRSNIYKGCRARPKNTFIIKNQRFPKPLDCILNLTLFENVNTVKSFKHGLLSFPAQVQGPFSAIVIGGSYYRSLRCPAIPFRAKDENQE